MKLDSIFKISDESYFKLDISLSIGSIAWFAYRWLQNTSLKEIIIDDLTFYAERVGTIDKNDDDDINLRINEVINIHSKVVTFLLVKYFKLLKDHLEALLSIEEKEKYKFTLSLPVMLELGTKEPAVIQLISSGITRSVALNIFEQYKLNNKKEDVDVFEWLRDKKNLEKLKPIFRRYLEKRNRLATSLKKT